MVSLAIQAQAKCIENKAAFILTPCCVGKIKHLLVKSGGGTVGNVDSSGVSGSADVDGDDHNLDHDHDGLGGRNLESLGAAAVDSKVQGGPGGGGGGVGGGDGGNGGGSSGGGDGDAAASSKRSYHRRRYVDSQVKRALKYPRSEWLRSEMTVDDYVKLVRLSDYNQHYVSGMSHSMPYFLLFSFSFSFSFLSWRCWVRYSSSLYLFTN